MGKRSFAQRLNVISRLAISFFIFLLLGAGALFVWAARDLPPPEAFAARRVVESTKIYDRSGEVVLYDVYGEEKRTVVPFSDIPETLRRAIIATEDDQFYSHIGIDLAGIVRSSAKNLLRGGIRQGGSTITQQLIRSAILTREQTLSRKIKEVILALEIEARYSKDEILGFYLNQIPFGSNIYGVEAASEAYFGKHVRDLTLSESAILAALPKAPSYYSPWGSRRDELLNRRNGILLRLESKGLISAAAREAAQAEMPKFLPPKQAIRAPHFVFEVREELERRFGKDTVEEGGLKVITTLNLSLQDIAEAAVAAGAKRNERAWRATNAALVALDPTKGEVLAMVGSRDYFDVARDGNVNVTTRPRQPGSSFKPIVYATALKRGYTQNTVVFDVPTEFAVGGAPSYKPQNYDGKSHGPVTMRLALANSLNVPSVKFLYLAGVRESIETARDLGVTTLEDENRYGLALVLGGAEVKLLEETAAFGVFANEGKRVASTLLLRVEDSRGNVLFAHEPASTRVLDAEIARTVTDIISDNDSRAMVFGLATPLVLPDRPVAAKTGTTQEFRDAWTVGYTPSLAAGVWVGNNDNTQMKKGADGVVVAAPIWNEFMRKALAKTPVESFTKPTPLTSTGKSVLDGNIIVETAVKIDARSGMPATPSTPPELVEERRFRQIHSILYWIRKEDPRGAPPQDPQDDPQFESWEQGVTEWVASQPGLRDSLSVPPSDGNNAPAKGNAPRIDVIAPQENTVLYRTQKLAIQSTIAADSGVSQTLVLTDGSLVGRLTQAGPDLFQGTFTPKWRSMMLDEGIEPLQAHTVVIRAFDRGGNVSETKISVFLQ